MWVFTACTLNLLQITTTNRDKGHGLWGLIWSSLGQHYISSSHNLNTGSTPRSQPQIMTTTTVHKGYCGLNLANSFFIFLIPIHWISFTSTFTDHCEDHCPWGCPWSLPGISTIDLLMACSLERYSRPTARSVVKTTICEAVCGLYLLQFIFTAFSSFLSSVTSTCFTCTTTTQHIISTSIHSILVLILSFQASNVPRFCTTWTPST